MTERATAWSITINNPTDLDMNATLPAGWSITGQIEKGEEGTEHYQALLKTTQTRFSAVKKVFPRAHIEIARNVKALANYVHKEESRLHSVGDRQSNIPTLFDYQHTVARAWSEDEFQSLLTKYKDEETGDSILRYADLLVERDIRAGMCGIEYIAINPMWRSAWKKFGRAMIDRERLADRQTDRVENEVVYPPAELISED